MLTLASPTGFTIFDTTPNGPAAFLFFVLLIYSLTMSFSIKWGMLLAISAWENLFLSHANSLKASHDTFSKLFSYLHYWVPKLYDPFLWMGFNCLKAAEPLWGDRLLFTIQFQGVPGTHLIYLGKMKGWTDLGATSGFELETPGLGMPLERLIK